jgi:C-terminal processing protease CtpA/Prc
MAVTSVAAAQRGVALADAMSKAAPAAAPSARGGARPRGPRRASAAAGTLTGPFLSHSSLSRAERLRLIDGLELVLEGVYTHLPLKRARYGFDPIQRLRILRTQVDLLDSDAFHVELADIVTRLRDAHTRYAGPSTLANKVAVLPFMVEMIGSTATPTYVVTKVAQGLDPAFRPGVVLEYWNGVPIDRAVQRHSDREVGGRPDSQRAWATQSLTFRSLRYGPPPDEHWVIVGYRSTTATGAPTGSMKEVKVPWQVIDPTDVSGQPPSGGPTGRASKALRRTRAVDPAAAAVRRAKMLLFAPGALTGEQAAPPQEELTGAAKPLAADIVPTTLTDTMKAMSIAAPGGPFAYLRIYGFDVLPNPFIAELVRLIPLLPDRGLIIDIRGNPGGYIWAAELALQLFTPRPIQPTRFSVLATAFTREMAELPSLADELAPWKASLTAAVRNAEQYAQPIPITNTADCNAIGQMYGGPVVLVADSTTYSSGDLFSAGFVDNGLGPFICVGEATGAGGANVWDYSDLKPELAGSSIELPALPDGIGLSFSFRRATRSGPNEGVPIEDIGVAGTPYAMTRDDLLAGNRDLISMCIAILKEQPLTRLATTLDKPNRKVTATSSGLDRLDVLLDGHPGSTHVLGGDATTSINYPAGTKVVELIGFTGEDMSQRRRLPVSS